MDLWTTLTLVPMEISILAVSTRVCHHSKGEITLVSHSGSIQTCKLFINMLKSVSVYVDKDRNSLDKPSKDVWKFFPLLETELGDEK